jgi:hypothetical protein
MLSAYTAYFDASRGNQDVLPGTWVCGFVSSVSAWESFEIDWTLALAKYGVPYFHMKSFTAKRKPFQERKWESEQYRAAFVSTLADIIHSNVMHSFGGGIWHTNFDFVNEQYELDKRFNPFAICGLYAAVKAHGFIRSTYSKQAPIEYIFDHGDEGIGFLMTEMAKAGLPAPIFKPSRAIADKPELVPAIQLQACDFAAWEMRREGNRRNGLEKGRKIRKSFEVLRQINHSWKHYIHKDLIALCDVARVPRRANIESHDTNAKGQTA